MKFSRNSFSNAEPNRTQVTEENGKDLNAWKCYNDMVQICKWKASYFIML